MKKAFLIFAASAALVSCNQKDTLPGNDCVMTVNIASPLTKASGTVPASGPYQSSDEVKIQNLQVVVFNGGNLDGYASSTSGESSISVNCTSGQRKVYVIANGPSAAAVTSEAALKELTSSLVEDPDNFCMVGSASPTIVNGGTYPVSVNRISSKIVVRKVTNKISSSAMASLPFSIERMYITNVAKSFNLGLDTYASANSDFANRGGYQAGNNLGSFTQDLAIGATVANGSSYTADHYFYAYPNNYDQSGYSASWSPKRTMLVLQVKIGSNLYDYPVTLPALEPNKMYVLNEIIIKNPGNPDDGNEGGSDEEDPITSGNCTFNVTVNDWTVVVIPDVTI